MKYQVHHFEDCDTALKTDVCSELMISFMDDFIANEIYSVNECVEFMGYHFTSEKNCLFVLTDGDKAIGTVSIHFQEPVGYTPNIGNLYVVPSYRGQELAADLLDFVFEYVRRNEPSIPYLYLWCENGLLSFYNRYGWEKVDTVNKKNIMRKSVTIISGRCI